jgi:hypothetical protein
MVKCCVFFAVRTEFINIIQMSFGFKELNYFRNCNIPISTCCTKHTTLLQVLHCFSGLESTRNARDRPIHGKSNSKLHFYDCQSLDTLPPSFLCHPGMNSIFSNKAFGKSWRYFSSPAYPVSLGGQNRSLFYGYHVFFPREFAGELRIH